MTVVSNSQARLRAHTLKQARLNGHNTTIMPHETLGPRASASQIKWIKGNQSPAPQRAHACYV